MSAPTEVYVFGDWRDLRRAVERADPEWMKQPEAERERLWAFAKGVLANYAPHHPKCIDCRKVMEPWEVYRCADCNAPLCEGCIKPHFGPQHRPHTRQDDTDAAREALSRSHSLPDDGGTPLTPLAEGQIPEAPGGHPHPNRGV